jgi:hypothetical protein
LASGTTGIAGLVAPKYNSVTGEAIANSSALANLGDLLGTVGNKVSGWYNDVFADDVGMNEIGSVDTGDYGGAYGPSIR